MFENYFVKMSWWFFEALIIIIITFQRKILQIGSHQINPKKKFSFKKETRSRNFSAIIILNKTWSRDGIDLNISKNFISTNLIE